jgi:hypothetical protein
MNDAVVKKDDEPVAVPTEEEKLAIASASLVSEATSWVRADNTAGKNGLKLIVKIADHVAKHRDWDALALIMGKVEAGRRRHIGRILWMRFGPALVGEVALGHPRGFKFTMKWDADKEFPVPNRWSVVLNAVNEGMRIDSPALHKEINAHISGARTPKAPDVAKYAETVAKWLEKANIQPAVLIAQLQRVEKEQREAAKLLKAA